MEATGHKRVQDSGELWTKILSAGSKQTIPLSGGVSTVWAAKGFSAGFQQIPKFMIYDVSIEGRNYRLEVNRTPSGWTCSLNGRPVQLDVALIRPGVLSLLIENQAYEVKREVGSEIH